MQDDPGESAPPRRAVLVWLGIVGLCGIIAVDCYFIVRRVHAPAAPSASPAPVAPPPLAAVAPAAPTSAALPSSAPSAEAAEAVFDEEGDEHARPAARAPRHFATVQEAAIGSCTTASVEGLSNQIIEQARCLNPSSVVRLPEHPNLVLGSHVFPYLHAEARARLLKVLKARPGAKMTVNSALRTVAQQYLVWRWSTSRRCGVELATLPGESNHELGLALDIADHAAWRAALEAEQFHWLGKTDLVHFDYQASHGPAPKPLDVLAFQKLWNRNHPADKLPESGEYGPTTEQKLKISPADGFPKGASCTARR